MEKTLKVGVIGTGTMAQRHIAALLAEPRTELCAVCGRNAERAQAVARKNGIGKCYADYHELLKDAELDAVVVVTPTYTHRDIVLDALRAGKHVLCEKPPALTVEETQECIDAAKACGKLLMYGFLVRFSQNIRFLKNYVDSGAMGHIFAVDVLRLQRCSLLGGWFMDKSKSGGGQLMDAAIHQIDAMLWLMGRPAIKTVRGFTDYSGAGLPGKIRGLAQGYAGVDNGNTPVRTTESMASAFVTFEGGAYMYIKASHVLNTVEEGTHIDICGTKAGARISSAGVELVRPDESGYFLKSTPVLTEKTENIRMQLAHFADCCLNGTPCLCAAETALPVMQLLCAVYRSAETGEEIRFS